MKRKHFHKALSTTGVLGGLVITAASALAQPQGGDGFRDGMRSGMMGDGSMGWMGGYGGMWSLILLVAIIAGVVGWLLAKKTK